MKNKKYAYSLAEVMVVMLILTIIFAAFAPIITRRKISDVRSAFTPWNFTDLTSTMNAYVSPSDNNLKNSVYFGIKPSTKEVANTINSPISAEYAKVVIKANDVNGKPQSHIQFRYGRNPVYSDSSINDYGDFAASLLVDDSMNILFTGHPIVGYSSSSDTASVPYVKNLKYGCSDSIYIGDYTANRGKLEGSGNVAIGYNALGSVEEGANLIGIGYNAGGSTMEALNGIFIGTNAGSDIDEFTDALYTQNLMLGYNTGRYRTDDTYSNGNLWEGTYNTFIGSYAGAGESYDPIHNIAVGYNALGKNEHGSYNIAFGAGALKNNSHGENNIALGYNACENVTTGKNKICIGYNSGPRPAVETETKGSINVPKYTEESGALNTAIAFQRGGSNGSFGFKDATTDEYNRIYIGGHPYEYGGDAVMEIHNIGLGSGASPTSNPQSGYSLINFPTDNLTGSTTVINGNLIVNGHAFFTIGNFLYPFYHESHAMGANNVEFYGLNEDYAGDDPYLPNLSSGFTFKKVTSDRRLKNILGLNNDGIDKLKDLKIYNYTFKNDPQKQPQVGVIAQELQKIFPTAVTTGADGYLRIRWHEMFFAAINAIKDIDVKIAVATKKLVNIEGQINKLEKENKILKAQVDSLSVRVNNLKNK